MSSAVVEPGYVIAGRYRVERLLGQGSMGSVYRALQLSIGRTVALKLLVDEHRGSAALVERFEREAHALSLLSHPNTVRLFDFGTEQGCPFLVMEFLQGCDLAADLERQGPLRWDQALSLLKAVAASLAEAHAARIVHRDIKPANIFLCSGGPWPKVKVLDFGIAGAVERGVARKLTLTGTVVGSAAYMSPEQAQGQRVGPAADLYALGAVLFEALTGKTPFEARLFTAQLLAKVLESAPRLRDACPRLEVPADLEALVSELLERDPARRPPSASAVSERIEALLDRASLPPLARTVSPAEPAAPTPGVAKTEPMLVARTIDEGWTPRRTVPLEPARRAARPRRPLAWVPAPLLLGLASFAAAFWASSSEPADPDTLASLAPPQPEALDPNSAGNALAPRTLDAPSLDTPSEASTLAAPLTLPPPPLLEEPSEPLLVSASAKEEASASPPGTATANTHSHRPNPRRSSPRNPTRAPSPAATPTSAPAATPTPAPAATPSPAPLDRRWRFDNVSTIRQALAAGVITPLQRNRLIAQLRERRYEARARATREYQAGRLGRRELRARQRAIEREFEGF